MKIDGQIQNKNWGWGTADEIMCIDFMVSDNHRGFHSQKISIDDKIVRVKSWLKSSYTRRWDFNINLVKCQNHAVKILNQLANLK